MGANNSKESLTNALETLQKRTVPANDPLWTQLFALRGLTWVDVAHFVYFDNVFAISHVHFDNIATLTNRCVEIFEQFLASTSQTDAEEQDRVLMAVRWLTRIAPALHEGYGSHAGITRLVDDNARRIGRAVLRLHFVVGFTCPFRKGTADEVGHRAEDQLNPHLLWENGIATQSAQSSVTAIVERNRLEVLRLLLVLLADVMYIQPTVVPTVATPVRGPFSDAIILPAPQGQGPMPHVSNLLISLMNTVLSYTPESWLPYAQAFMPSDSRQTLVRIAVGVVAAVLDYAPPENMFRAVLATFAQGTEFQFMYAGFTHLLNNPVRAANTYLPSSMESIDFSMSLLSIVFRLLTTNRNVLFYFIASPTIAQDMVVPLLFLAHEALPHANRFRVVECCAYIMLVLSSVRDFGIAINEPYDGKSPLYTVHPLGEKPTFADLMVVSFFETMLLGPPWVGSLYECLLTVLANVSPYLKGLNAAAAQRLLHMCEVFAKPAYLKATPLNHVFICYLVEVLNNLIQYHYEGNVNVVYEILSRRIVFYQLAHTPELPAAVSPSANSVSPVDDKGKRRKSEIEAEARTPPASDAAAATTSSTPTATGAVVPVSAEDELKAIQHEREWKSKLQIETIVRVLEVLVPQLDKFYDKASGYAQRPQLLAYLGKTTLVGLLPPPHIIVMRQYTRNAVTDSWMQTAVWADIFQRMFSFGIFDPRTIKLFQVQLPPGLQFMLEQGSGLRQQVVRQQQTGQTGQNAPQSEEPPIQPLERSLPASPPPQLVDREPVAQSAEKGSSETHRAQVERVLVDTDVHVRLQPDAEGEVHVSVGSN